MANDQPMPFSGMQPFGGEPLPMPPLYLVGELRKIAAYGRPDLFRTDLSFYIMPEIRIGEHFGVDPVHRWSDDTELVRQAPHYNGNEDNPRTYHGSTAHTNVELRRISVGQLRDEVQALFGLPNDGIRILPPKGARNQLPSGEAAQPGVTIHPAYQTSEGTVELDIEKIDGEKYRADMLYMAKQLEQMAVVFWDILGREGILATPPNDESSFWLAPREGSLMFRLATPEIGERFMRHLEAAAVAAGFTDDDLHLRFTQGGWPFTSEMFEGRTNRHMESPDFSGEINKRIMHDPAKYQTFMDTIIARKSEIRADLQAVAREGRGHESNVWFEWAGISGAAEPGRGRQAEQSKVRRHGEVVYFPDSLNGALVSELGYLRETHDVSITRVQGSEVGDRSGQRYTKLDFATADDRLAVPDLMDLIVKLAQQAEREQGKKRQV